MSDTYDYDPSEEEIDALNDASDDYNTAKTAIDAKLAPPPHVAERVSDAEWDALKAKAAALQAALDAIAQS